MSNGTEICSPCCFNSLAVNKEYARIKIKLKHKDEWYDSNFPVYTCKKCGKSWAIERVTK